METIKLKVTSSVGLHARPAAEFVKQASRFQSVLHLRNITRVSDWVDAKSILSVLTLGVEKDHEIELRAEGDDEADALRYLSDLVESNFDGKF